ncbi:TIGR04219 family outer membrane beta-barrel protein [Aestuariibacter halophilus]|uniref:TIGR04219 family outer membrane beta-barrel protein n=1 Tax=Fluctibacter halophilus TaxID=226011 RepID=A0ABS8GEA6_9ALTE|nr:TIGR04219 family outer membrane beta-barrel protein [Aestuariibacter halophilus]MCC2618240.1 TIGR04219 family outer membrane beta-barrel protein [Aestuariibacter halophilus]
MKKHTLLLSAATLLFSGAAYSDTVFGIYAGAQAWQMDASGGYANTSTITEFDFDDATRNNLYVALEHPIPGIPNIKVQRTSMDTDGVTTLSSSFTFGDQVFVSQSQVMTDVTLTSTDVVLYYELFDNDLLSLDFGLNAKYVDGDFLVVDTSDPTLDGQESFSGFVPMLYSRISFGLPGTGFSLGAEGSFLSVDDHTLQDYQLAVTYELVENPAVDANLQLGYRKIQMELDDLDNIYSDLDFDGPFVGLEVHF